MHACPVITDSTGEGGDGVFIRRNYLLGYLQSYACRVFTGSFGKEIDLCFCFW